MELNANKVIVSSVVVVVCVVLAMTLTNSNFASPKTYPTSEPIPNASENYDALSDDAVEPEPAPTATPGVGVIFIDPANPTSSNTLNNMLADQNAQAQEAIATRYNLLFQAMYRMSEEEVNAYEAIRGTSVNASEVELARINAELLAAMPWLEVVDTTLLDETRINLAYTTLAEQAYVEYLIVSPPNAVTKANGMAVTVDGYSATIAYTQVNFDEATQGYTRQFGLDTVGKFVYVDDQWYLTFNS